MAKPINAEEALERGLILLKDGQIDIDAKGIHTFSNGTEWECWAEGNCLSCKWYELDGAAGEWCAFEYAALVASVTPDMARLFGWVQTTQEYGWRDGWEKPNQCPFFGQRSDDEDGGRSLEPTPDPAQLVLIADPTEDIALAVAPAPQEVSYV